VFPAKEIKPERWSGFGQGFQTKVDELASKRGIKVQYDEQGKMTTPYDLTREVNVVSTAQEDRPGTGKRQPSLSTAGIESNFMRHYGSTPDTFPNLYR
jgi:hypothetical protein